MQQFDNEDAGRVDEANKPRTRRGQARATAILDVARDLFIQGGYAEITMRKVAGRLGISLSNVQHYFPTRDALLEALLLQVMKAYDPTYAEITKGVKDPGEQLAAIIRYLISDARLAETERLFVEIWSLATRDQTAREIFDRMYSHHRKNMERFVQAANPKLSPSQVSLRSALIAMQIEGLMLLISDAKPKHTELAGLEEECLASIFRVIEAPLPGRIG